MRVLSFKYFKAQPPPTAPEFFFVDFPAFIRYLSRSLWNLLGERVLE